MIKRRFFQGILLIALLAGGFNNCSRQISFEEVGLDLKSMDTVVGNPLTRSAKTFLGEICRILTNCHPQLTEQDCHLGVLKTTGLTSQFAVSNYALYSDLVSAESNGSVRANSVASEVCLSGFSQLKCSDSSVQNAYNPSAGEPFSGVSLMVPTAPGSCPSVFTQPPLRKEYYVATTGSDSNDGSVDRPWATIQHASEAMLVGPEGATVHVAPGTYSLPTRPSCNTGGGSCGISTTRSGTLSAPIVFISDQQWGAKLVPADAYSIWFNSGDYVSIIGFEFIGNSSSNIGIYSLGSFGRILGNRIHDISGSLGCSLSQGNGGVVVGGDGSTRQGSEVIGNLIYNVGPFPAIGAPPSSYCNHSHGIEIKQTSAKVQNNIIHRIGAFGIVNWENSTNLTITHNLVFNSGWADSANSYYGGGIFLAQDSVNTIMNSTVSNNIVRNNRGVGFRSDATSSSNVFANNIVFANGRNFHNSFPQVGTINSDPLMENFRIDGSGDYRLQPSSPAINSASTSCSSGHSGPCLPTIDFSGFARPYGTSGDIGPYEWHP